MLVMIGKDDLPFHAKIPPVAKTIQSSRENHEDGVYVVLWCIQCPWYHDFVRDGRLD